MWPDGDEIRCATKTELETLVKYGDTRDIQFVLAGPGIPGLSIEELGQALSMAFRKSSIIYASEHRESFDHQKLKKNGFQLAVLLPDEGDRFERMLNDVTSTFRRGGYSIAPFVDFASGTKIDFRIALFDSVTKKIAIYLTAGSTLLPEQLQRLKQMPKNAILVPVEDLAKFHELSAKRIVQLSSQRDLRDGLISSTCELFQSTIAESWARAAKQKDVVSHAREILYQCIRLLQPPQWYWALRAKYPPRAEESHETSVSIFATLFAMTCEGVRPYEMEAASQVHDLSLSLLSDKIRQKNFVRLTRTEKIQFHRHPQTCVELLRSNSLNVPETVFKTILQHHEKWNGTGFPSGLGGASLSEESQILALADRFAELTEASANSISPLSPGQAFDQIEKEELVGPDFMRKIRLIFDRGSKAFL